MVTHLTMIIWFIWSILQSNNLAVIALTTHPSTSSSAICKEHGNNMNSRRTQKLHAGELRQRNNLLVAYIWLDHKEYDQTHWNQDRPTTSISSWLHSHHGEDLSNQVRIKKQYVKGHKHVTSNLKKKKLLVKLTNSYHSFSAMKNLLNEIPSMHLASESGRSLEADIPTRI